MMCSPYFPLQILNPHKPTSNYRLDTSNVLLGYGIRNRMDLLIPGFPHHTCVGLPNKLLHKLPATTLPPSMLISPHHSNHPHFE
ncbi:hypothetical protein CDL15_Pgr028762 [Punica granatum]|uniref:Uncharacterized protein n=1 Tax=Punica granatum TaxID=22663 RepID=A0A218VWU1_PUNGR|nr:hypothetical protein CDL15_Pgr028762 [Punica granatum]